MKTHIIHAHPEPLSFVAAMRNTIATHFESQGHDVTLSDLYAKRFNPVASAQDFLERSRADYLVYSLEQRNAHKKGKLSPDIAEELNLVLAADLLVITFPLFWFGVPAILKGWIDRVFVSGVFYGGKRIYGKGGLKGKRVFVAFSLGGQAHMFGPEAIHTELTNGMLRHFFQGTLGYVGLEVIEPFIAYHVPYINDEERGKTLRDLKSALVDLESRPSLPMPDLSHFNDIFEPIQGTP